MVNGNAADSEAATGRLVSRRTMVGGAAFAVPAVVMMATTPAFAESQSRRVSIETTPVSQASSSAVSASAAATSIDWTVRVTVSDGSGLLLTGQQVELSGIDGLSFREVSGLTGGAGKEFTTVASLTKTPSGSVLLTASAVDAAGVVSASTVLAVPVASVAITLSSPRVPIGGSTTATVTLKDALGGQVANAPVSLSGSGFSFAQAAGTTSRYGRYSTTVTAEGNNGGAVTATAMGIGEEITGAAELTVVDRRLDISFSPETPAPGGNTQVTVTLTDGAGAPLANQGVQLEPSTGFWVTKSARYITNESGQVVTTLGTTGGVSQATLRAAASLNGSSATAFSVEKTLTFAASGVGLRCSDNRVSGGTSNKVSLSATVTENGKPVKGRTVYFYFTPSSRNWGSALSTWPASEDVDAQTMTAVTGQNGVAIVSDTLTLRQGVSAVLSHVRYAATLSSPPVLTPGDYVDVAVAN